MSFGFLNNIYICKIVDTTISLIGGKYNNFGNMHFGRNPKIKAITSEEALQSHKKSGSMFIIVIEVTQNM